MKLHQHILLLILASMSAHALSDSVEDRLRELKDSLGQLARQVMLQQFSNEHRSRGNGYSGIKNTRATFFGPMNYYSASHTSARYIGMHDHTDFVNTMGMGEVGVVINGVDFTTRHNDYLIVKQSSTSREFHATEPIQFPDVPPSVLAKKSIAGQVEEMQAYFKAFKEQNTTLRDFRPYFKAALCYLEGAWTLDKHIEEPFLSDRHNLDAESWEELMRSVRYAAYSGTKSPKENYAYLPTALFGFNRTTGEPVYAQWNYRILCSPIQEDIPTKYLKQIVDLKYEVPRKKVGKDNRNMRSARFVLYESDKFRYQLSGIMDRIFYEIVGKDNIPSGLTLASYGHPLLRYGTEPREPLDTSRYSRVTELAERDAMGNNFMARGFNDPNLWIAETTQPRIAPVTVDKCTTQRVNGRRERQCQSVEARFSYAIPLEIIYMTPLWRWNPYDLPYTDTLRASTAGGKNGRTPDTAFNGTDRSHYYKTPVEFYMGSEAESEEEVDAADTAEMGVWVRDKSGVARNCAPSGQMIMTKDIKNVGPIKLRYPVAPVYGEGSGVWKEVNALKSLVLSGAVPSSAGGGSPSNPDYSKLVTFTMSKTYKEPAHTHQFNMSAYDIKRVRDQNQVKTVVTSESNGHTHQLVVLFRKGRFEYRYCDTKRTCPDGHGKEILPNEEELAQVV